MKNIEPVLYEYKEVIAQNEFGKPYSELTESQQRKCYLAARIYAYKKTILPDGYDNYTIFDFNNFDKHRRMILDPEIAIELKDRISRYCWGVPWKTIHDQAFDDVKAASSFLKEHRSTLLRRRKMGQNVVIHGDAERAKGRTFLASIIMREAILTKCIPSNTYTFDWVDATQLMSAAIKDDSDISEYKSCDWIVIDNITRYKISDAARAYRISLLNDFFIERFEDKLPTILVCKFSLNDPEFDPLQEFGSGFARMVEDKRRTMRLAMSKEATPDDDISPE